MNMNMTRPPIRRIAPPLIALLSLASIALVLPLQAQNTVTLTPSITAGDGSVTIPTMSWVTAPLLTVGTPCQAAATPPLSGWTGAKAGSGTVTNLGIPTSTRLTLSCTFAGDSIVTFTWTLPTQNTDGSPYINPKLVRLKYTFNSNLTTNPAVAASGETHVDAPHPQLVKTVTGVASTGTLRANAYAQNTDNLFSVASVAVMKTFTGSVVVNQGVDITVRTIPNGVPTLTAE